MKNWMAVAVIVLASLLSACKEGPAVRAAKQEAAAYQDTLKAREIIDEFGPQEVDCWIWAPKAFDKATGNPRIWVATRGIDTRLECYNAPGYHPATKEKLTPITPKQAEDIRIEEETYAPPAPCPRQGRRCPTPAPPVVTMQEQATPPVATAPTPALEPLIETPPQRACRPCKRQ